MVLNFGMILRLHCCLNYRYRNDDDSLPLDPTSYLSCLRECHRKLSESKFALPVVVVAHLCLIMMTSDFYGRNTEYLIG